MMVNLRSALQTITYQAQWIECNTSVGNFVIQQGHAPMILALSTGQPIKLMLNDNTFKIFSVNTTGFVEITPDGITILLPLLIEVP